MLGDVVASATEGPWRRIQTFGSETGAYGQMPPMPDPGESTRVGVPAVDGTGRWLGHALSADAPLAAYDAAAPTDPYVRAVRFAVGELVVG
nr:hypothetical protein [Actinomycetota bacterium]